MAFDFGTFLRETTSRIDSLQKKKDERNKLRDMQAQDMANRQMSEIESAGRQNRFALNQKAQMEKKAFETADDNEYYRKKAAWDVKAGNMNPDTYDMLYSGAAAIGGFPAARGGLRGKAGQDQEPDYMDILSKAYAAKPEDDARTFSQYAAEEMEGLRTTFPQQEQQGRNPDDIALMQKPFQQFKVGRGGKTFDVDTSGPRAKWTQANNSTYNPPERRTNILNPGTPGMMNPSISSIQQPAQGSMQRKSMQMNNQQNENQPIFRDFKFDAEKKKKTYPRAGSNNMWAPRS